MFDCVFNYVRQEIAHVSCRRSRRKATVQTLAEGVTLPRLESFSWGNVCDDLSRNTPSLYRFLDVVLPPQSTLENSIAPNRRYVQHIYSS